MMAIVLPANIAAPRLAERLGQPLVIAIGACLAAAGAFGALVLARGTSYGALCGQLVALGGGLGLLVPPMTAMLLGGVDKAHSGVASGVLNAARQTGSVIGVALFGSFVANKGAFVFGARLSLAVAGALLLVSAALALWGRRGQSEDGRARRA